jgi:hypothetical protein
MAEVPPLVVYPARWHAYDSTHSFGSSHDAIALGNGAGDTVKPLTAKTIRLPLARAPANSFVCLKGPMVVGRARHETPMY